MLQDSSSAPTTAKSKSEKSSPDEEEKDIMKLTSSEARRNIGSVTCFLDPKIFEENLRTHNYCTEEIWLPIKDITVTPATTASTKVSFNNNTFFFSF